MFNLYARYIHINNSQSKYKHNPHDDDDDDEQIQSNILFRARTNALGQPRARGWGDHSNIAQFALSRRIIDHQRTKSRKNVFSSTSPSGFRAGSFVSVVIPLRIPSTVSQ